MSTDKRSKISRRGFLKGAAAAAAAAAAAGCAVEQPAVGQENAAPASLGQPTPLAVPVQYPQVPYTPKGPPPLGLLQVLSPHEARTVEALTARILPGSPDDPGAREAGVVYYIDNFLAYQEGLPEPTYRVAPYAQTYDPADPPPEALAWLQAQGLPVPASGQGGGSRGAENGGAGEGGAGSGAGQGPHPTPPANYTPAPNLMPTPPNQGAQIAPSVTAVLPGPLATGEPGGGLAGAPTADAQALTATAVLPGPLATAEPGGAPQAGQNQPAAGYTTIWIPGEMASRYGYQSILTPRDVYRMGVAAVDRYASSLFGHDFIELSEAQQDQIVGDMADGSATGFDRQLSAQAFFHNLRRHTSEGMFSDPAYGGNHNLVGWKLVGYPGAQRAYDPAEFQTEGSSRQPQSIAMMHAFNAGQPANDQVIVPVSGTNPDRPHAPAPPPVELNPTVGPRDQ